VSDNPVCRRRCGIVIHLCSFDLKGLDFKAYSFTTGIVFRFKMCNLHTPRNAPTASQNGKIALTSLKSRKRVCNLIMRDIASEICCKIYDTRHYALILRKHECLSKTCRIVQARTLMQSRFTKRSNNEVNSVTCKAARLTVVSISHNEGSNFIYNGTSSNLRKLLRDLQSNLLACEDALNKRRKTYITRPSWHYFWHFLNNSSDDGQ
jgi:hypothetical protein